MVHMVAFAQALHEVIDGACPQSKEFNIVRCSGCAQQRMLPCAPTKPWLLHRSISITQTTCHAKYAALMSFLQMLHLHARVALS